MIQDRFIVPAKLKTTGFALMGLGILTIIAGIVFLLFTNPSEANTARFWISLAHNAVFFLVMSLASVFILAASSLGQGSWITAYRRVPEAIASNVWVFGIVTIIILFAIVFGLGHHNPIYHWVHPDATDKVLLGKTPFLNSGVFVGFTVVTIALWSFFGLRFRKLSLDQQAAPKNSTKIYWKTTVWAGAFLLVYGLSMMSTTPWIWIMSIDAHWYSTLFSWYVFASSFVSGMAVILLFVVYLKNQGNLFLVTKEHMHDLGKFMFAFSIFWTYLWFSQYMLIWYANIPEETTYFAIRQQGPYSIVFYFTLVLNFVLPILVLMSAPSKRNYFTIVFMAVMIIFGHWLDFYIMMVPGPVGAEWHIDWYELGIFFGFSGLMITVVSRSLAKYNLITENNPLLKESVIHLT